MNILKNIEITPFLKTVWVSQAAKDLWAPIVRKVSLMVHDLEVKSVANGLRRCAWQTIDENRIDSFTADCEKVGLNVLPIRRVGKWEGFAHRTFEAQPGQPANLYCIISKSAQDALDYRKAFEHGDNDKQGDFLGFPGCCRSFFSETFERGFVDPIWQWAGETNLDSHSRSLKSHQLSNPLLRYIGVRGGFHIPCGPFCQDTISRAETRLELGEKDTVNMLMALLSMPMQWSALKGIAVVKTPIFQVITSTMVTDRKYTVNVEGEFIPKEGVRGGGFPYKTE